MTLSNTHLIELSNTQVNHNSVCRAARDFAGSVNYVFV